MYKTYYVVTTLTGFNVYSYRKPNVQIIGTIRSECIDKAYIRGRDFHMIWRNTKPKNNN